MMDLIKGSNFSLSVALEGGALLATYPYDRPQKRGEICNKLNLGIILFTYL